MSRHISVDIGGSAARCFLAEFDGASLTVSPLHTFSNKPVSVAGEWFWDARGLFAGIKQALRIARERCGDAIDSVGVDSMGNAFGLLGADGRLLEAPAYTRVPQEDRIVDRLFDRIEPADLYAIVGLEQAKLNSLYHLLRYQADKPELLGKARHFLMLPDLLCYWLTGEIASEYTIASTSYLLDAKKRDWSRTLIGRLGFDENIFPRVMPAGGVLGRLRPELADETGLRGVSVVHAAMHDTASAIMCIEEATPASGFISSGTWGMLGCKLDEPLLTREALAANFANEGAAFGRIQFVHNAPSMSILQQCMDEWKAAGRGITWDELFAQAEQVRPFAAVMDIEAPCFRQRGSMAEHIRDYCRATGQPVPETPGQIARAVIESITLNYMEAMDDMRRLVGEGFGELTVVGGGARVGMLMRSMAGALDLPLRTGPAESSSLGNILMQLLATRNIDSIAAGRSLLGKNVASAWTPDGSVARWRDAGARLGALHQV